MIIEIGNYRVIIIEEFFKRIIIQLVNVLVFFVIVGKWTIIVIIVSHDNNRMPEMSIPLIPIANSTQLIV